MSKNERWIVITNWAKFQHYKDRRPPWIKNYIELLARDEYLELSGARRGLLHGLWLAYAQSGTTMRADIKLINSRLGLQAKMVDLEALNHAGFITLSASKTLAARYQDASPEQRESKKEKEQALTSKADASANGLDPEKTLELGKIIEQLRGVDDRTWNILQPLAAQVPQSILADLRTRSTGKGPGWIVRALQAEIKATIGGA
ncbi:MAG: hypothetical protein NUW01_04500 [Gemmatimonadaceae bacterium]|nr:hypothetical protein [Gemmatimonadaceae bacterium]